MRQLVIALIFLFTGLQALAAEPDFIALCYHDVRADVDGSVDADSAAISRANLINHFSWLRLNGYHPVSMDDIIVARSGGDPLPDRAVLLSFDDGYESFYTDVYPLLQRFHYPAIVGLVTSWMEAGNNDSVDYGHEQKSRQGFLSWDQVREMQASGLVEVASHSHDGHRGILGNPQGNQQPFMTTRRYDATSATYETESQYETRIRNDLQTSYRIIKARTGIAPRTLVWPYGEFNSHTWTIAESIGFSQSLALGNPDKTRLQGEQIYRHLIDGNPSMAALNDYYLQAPSWKTPVRVIHADLDYVYDKNPQQQQKNLDKLIQRIADYRVTTVFLQAFADPDGNGQADALYYPNRHLPMRANLFNHVAWQLRTRAGVKVFAWMPVSAFELPEKNADWMVMRTDDQGTKVSEVHYRRLSIFNPNAAQWIDELYQDLGRYNHFAGILFHDDGLLTDFEDANPHAMQWYQQQGLHDFAISNAHQDPALMTRWTDLKMQALTDFTLARAASVRAERPALLTARNLFAAPILSPQSRNWFAQSLQNFTQSYDYTAVMAMPFMEGAKKPVEWIENLVEAVEQTDKGNGEIIYELQARDWKSNKMVDPQLLAQQMHQLLISGQINFGYYPDNFIADEPPMEKIRPHISVEDYPWRRR